MLAVNVNIPFSHWLRSDSRSVWRHASASYSLSHDLNGRVTNLAGLYGTCWKTTTSAIACRPAMRAAATATAGAQAITALNYRGGYGNANVGYSRSDGFETALLRGQRRRAGARQRHHLSQPLNDTVVLVKAPAPAA